MTASDVEELPLHGLDMQAERLRSHALVVYEFDCDRIAAESARLERVLDAAELQVVERLRQPIRRRRSTVVRALLRRVLGAHLQMPPEDVPLYRQSNGRPRLRRCNGAAELNVGCTASGELAAIAVACGAEAGIDLERVCARRFPDGVAATMLHPRELALFEDLPPGARAAWLASAWVCKEATLKALGLGLGVDPRAVEIMASSRPADCGTLQFHPAGFAPLHGWLYRRGNILKALVSSRPGLQPLIVRLSA